MYNKIRGLSLNARSTWRLSIRTHSFVIVKTVEDMQTESWCVHSPPTVLVTAFMRTIWSQTIPGDKAFAILHIKRLNQLAAGEAEDTVSFGHTREPAHTLWSSVEADAVLTRIWTSDPRTLCHQQPYLSQRCTVHLPKGPEASHTGHKLLNGLHCLAELKKKDYGGENVPVDFFFSFNSIH